MIDIDTDTTQQDKILTQYYAILDPSKRKEVLKAYIDAFPEDKLNTLRKELWTLRYTDPKTKTDSVDLFLWQCVNLLYIYKTSGMVLFNKSGTKEILKLRTTMGYEQAQKYGSEGQKILYQEFLNATQRYYQVCSRDKHYRKKLFGIAVMRGDEYQKKLTQDAWRLAQGLKEKFNINKEMEPFCKAAKDAYFKFEPQAEKLWEEYIQKISQSGKKTNKEGMSA